MGFDLQRIFRAICSGCLTLAMVASMAGCVTSVPRPSAVTTYAVSASVTGNTALGRYVEAAAAAAPARAGDEAAERSGFRLVSDGSMALAARLALIDLAEDSIDLQYYIFNGDVTGSLIADRLLAAADRGVRVRMLLDDMGARIGDIKIATLSVHENIEIRLFNPLSLRHEWLRYLSKVSEFGRVNYRMHNKLMIVDNQVMITGGRNIGDEYFMLQTLDFQDIDTIGVGSVSVRASQSLDEYWNSFNAIPIEDVSRWRADARDLERLRRRLDRRRTGERQQAYLQVIAELAFTEAFREGTLEWRWGAFEWLYDPPSKADPSSTLGGAPHLMLELLSHLDDVRQELLIMSPYLIPGQVGIERLRDLVAQGVAVGVLTNSLGTTDVLAVHSGYARYRRPLLATGVELWELRRLAGQQDRVSAFVGDSSASLHAKTFVYDRERLFIGSVNLDPRSINLNTEAGVLIHEPALAGEAARLFERWTAPSHAFRVTLQGDGALRWQADGEPAYRDPEAGWARRLFSWALGLLPIESQL